MSTTHYTYIDNGHDTFIAEQVIGGLEDEGYTTAEIIGGLLYALILIAERSPAPDAVLDEIANALAEGTVE